ncbi:LacI family DNA-binding transcriptional regulator [uncultured Arthrobacter sp.]|uniref:LacI family DNA-binding transcriptional regulator n=1 Tax=uncultured Arthrobacter sp. TaxID=114050 RepID=UPI00260EFA8C|nr:LacI family DNA-binding transcriptional regulator [uncultured Arthrobacter sp.]
MATTNTTTPKATLASVAEIAGVSIPTVSKVLNGRDDVAAATRDRVLEVMRSLNYRSPSPRRRTDSVMIDVVVESVTTAYYSEVMDGILECTSENGAEVVLSAMSLEAASAAERVRRMLDAGRRGLLLVTSKWGPSDILTFQERGIPVVLVDPLNPPGSDVVSVGATNWAGGKAATEHLLDLGHERIAHLGGPVRAECSQDRQHGYMAALLGRGVEVRPEYIISRDFTRSFGIEGLAQLLELPEPPTAIFAANDTIAIGVWEEARRRGMKLPGDLSIVGFDGTSFAEATMPQLTTVEQPLREIGRAAARTLLRQIDGEQPDSTRIELATRLLVRESTASPK